MCGITGIVKLNQGVQPGIDLLRKMCGTLIHRGPDDEGLDIRDGVALGIRRLAIIDVEGGQQPFFNQDQTVRAIFNGEIYNFLELRAMLEKKGYLFKTACDGEVIVHLWDEFGKDFVHYLNGMFAIALHDQKRKQFILVRDRIGIKPLFYTFGKECLVFGSEIKAILASDLVERQLNFNGLGQFLAWEYIPGQETLFKGIQKLEPASFLEVDLQSGQKRLETWWDVPLREESRNKTDEQWQEAIDKKLQESIQRRLMSDVPLGALLSGGVDSSLVTAGMGNAKTFSIGFEDPSYNELPWAKKVAKHLGSEHRFEIIQPHVLELFDQLMPFMDDPIGDFSIFPTYLVSRLARQKVTVALSGDGGDELFGGYETYLAEQLAKKWRIIPPFLRQPIESVILSLRDQERKKGLINKAKRFVERVNLPENLAHTRWRLFLDGEERRSMFTEEALREMAVPVEDHILKLFQKAQPRDEIDRWLYVDLKSYLCDNILVKVDRMSMACSLEARVPFLDHELVELAFQIPSHLKINKHKTKYLLKKIAAKKIPQECVYRQKEGFSIPIKNWLSHEYRPLLEEYLAPEKIQQEGIFRPQKLEQLKREHFSKRANHSHLLWAILVFQDWRKRWKV